MRSRYNTNLAIDRDDCKSITNPRNKVVLNQELMISPNPTKGLFDIYFPNQMERAEIKIFDIQGKVIFAKNIDVDRDYIQVDLSESVDGMYIVYLSDKTGNQLSRKLVVQK